MSRGVSSSAVDKVLESTAQGPRPGADLRSKNVRNLERAAGRRHKLRFAYSRTIRRTLLPFVAGFATCAWMGFMKKPPEIVVKKVVRKKKPPAPTGPIIEELPDENPVVPTMAGAPGEETKLVLVVNEELKMGAGKVAAQCCHATLAVYQSLEGRHRNVLRQWEAEGQKKIALKCKTTAQLRELAAKAECARIPSYLVADAGRTQVAAGAHTVLAVGPAPESVINAITGELRLL